MTPYEEPKRYTFAVHLLCIGPALTVPVVIGDGVVAEPAGYYGSQRPDFVSAFTKRLLQSDVEFVVDMAPFTPPETREPVITINTTVEAVDHKQAIAVSACALNEAMIAFAAGHSASIRPFGRVAVSDSTAYIVTDLPPESGLDWISCGDRTQTEYSTNIIYSALPGDDRLSHLLDLYHLAMGADHADLQVSLLFLTLEAIVAGINQQMGGNNSKNSILLDLDYNEMSLPLFQIGTEPPQTLNHIDLAYEIRTSFFHGGRDHARNVRPAIKAAFTFYQKAPDLFTLALAFDCWATLVDWASHSSKAYKAWNGEEVPTERCPVLQGPSYRRHFVSHALPRRGAAGTIIRRGEKLGNVLFPFIVRFRRDPVALQVVCPGGQDPDAAITFPLGYKLVLPLE